MEVSTEAATPPQKRQRVSRKKELKEGVYHVLIHDLEAFQNLLQAIKQTDKQTLYMKLLRYGDEDADALKEGNTTADEENEQPESRFCGLKIRAVDDGCSHYSYGTVYDLQVETHESDVDTEFPPVAMDMDKFMAMCVKNISTKQYGSLRFEVDINGDDLVIVALPRKEESKETYTTEGSIMPSIEPVFRVGELRFNTPCVDFLQTVWDAMLDMDNNTKLRHILIDTSVLGVVTNAAIACGASVMDIIWSCSPIPVDKILSSEEDYVVEKVISEIAFHVEKTAHVKSGMRLPIEAAEILPFCKVQVIFNDSEESRDEILVGNGEQRRLKKEIPPGALQPRWRLCVSVKEMKTALAAIKHMSSNALLEFYIPPEVNVADCLRFNMPPVRGVKLGLFQQRCDPNSQVPTVKSRVFLGAKIAQY